jgi:hypothetical protein
MIHVGRCSPLEEGGLLMYHTLQLQVTSETGVPVVRFTIAGESSVLGVTDVDAMIGQLARIRQTMQPAHPFARPATEYPLEVDPSWHVDISVQFDGAILSMRHAGIGWMAYALPTSSLAKLAETLSSMSSAATPIAKPMFN